LLDGYETEQAPVAVLGAGQMAEAARQNMARTAGEVDVMRGGRWGVAVTRMLLGVSLDVDGTGSWSMIRDEDEPGPVRPGDRVPDLALHSTNGPVHLHDLTADAFTALYFTDTRRRPRIPVSTGPALRHYVVSRWDAPLDSPLRALALLDPGDRVRRRFALADDTVVLLRPDGHVAAIRRFDPAGDDDVGERLYQAAVGRPSPAAAAAVRAAPRPGRSADGVTHREALETNGAHHAAR
jgi:3-(3-hydroxy-phenyl)propionate hydroxylase